VCVQHTAGRSNVTLAVRADVSLGLPFLLVYLPALFLPFFLISLSSILPFFPFRFSSLPVSSLFNFLLYLHISLLFSFTQPFYFYRISGFHSSKLNITAPLRNDTVLSGT
jgi:hypothetical protein